MTIQHGPDQSPHRRQRWIEIENVGSSDIPPHGVVEVVDHYRPEKDSTETPGGGPTVVKVQRPTKDEPCPLLINGPCTVKVGKRSRIGTNDYPALALLGESPDCTGQTFGAKKDSYQLWKGLCGFLVWGDYDGEKAQVVRWDDCGDLVPVRALDCILPGTISTVRRMRYKSNGSYEDTGEDVQVIDVYCYIFAIKDEIFWVKRQTCDCDTSSYYTPVYPYGNIREVRVYNKIEAGATGYATVLGPSSIPSCVFEPTSCTIQIVNHTKRPLACDTYEDVKAFLMPAMCCWEVPSAPRPNMAIATLSSDMCTGGSASLSNVQYKDITQWPVTPTSATNPFNLVAKKGDNVLIGFDASACEWYVIQVQHCIAERIMSDVRRNGCSIERQVYEKVAIQACDCNPTWQSAITLYTQQFISDIAVDCGTGGTGSTCEVKARKKQCCIFDDTCTDLGWSTILSGTTETFMTDVYQQGTDVWGDFMDVCVLCVYGTSSSIVLEGTDCETGTGT